MWQRELLCGFVMWLLPSCMVIWLCGLWTVMWQGELLRGFVMWRGVACCYLAVWFVDCNVAT